jgi:hypothetical protein
MAELGLPVKAGIATDVKTSFEWHTEFSSPHKRWKERPIVDQIWARELVVVVGEPPEVTQF